MNGAIDATILRQSFIGVKKSLSNERSVVVSDIVAGEHSNQCGGFEIETNQHIVSVYVWAPSTVEIHSISMITGETKNIETLENITIQEFEKAIIFHIEQYT